MEANRQQQFLADGYCFPIPALSAEVAEDYRRRFHAFDSSARARAFDDLHNQVYLFKPHLFLNWVDALVHEPAILDIAESVLGPDLLCWSAGVFQKPPHSDTYVTWHQDAVYYGLSPVDHAVRVWVALSATTADNGTMEFARAAHKVGLKRHLPLDQSDNLLSLGEEVDLDLARYEKVTVTLQPGEVSLHHLHMPHASGANRSDGHRINLVITYVAPDVRPASGLDSALLVRGVDRFRHFQAEQRLDREFSDWAVRAHARAMELRRRVFASAEPAFDA